MGDNASAVPKIRSNGYHLELVDKFFRPLKPAFQCSGKDSTSLSHLLDRQLVLWMGFEERIADRFQIPAVLEIFPDLQGAVAMPVHSYRQGLHTFGQYPGIERGEGRTGMFGKKSHLVDQF